MRKERRYGRSEGEGRRAGEGGSNGEEQGRSVGGI